jgi:hypothetical protein
MQGPAPDRVRCLEFLDALGYPYAEERDNPAYEVFLR